jgi:hypothetical protein
MWFPAPGHISAGQFHFLRDLPVDAYFCSLRFHLSLFHIESLPGSASFKIAANIALFPFAGFLVLRCFISCLYLLPFQRHPQSVLSSSSSMSASGQDRR